MKITFTSLLIVLSSLQFVFAQGSSNMAVNLIRTSTNSGDYFSPGNVLNMGTQNFTLEVKILVNSFPQIADYGAKIINKGLSTSGTPQNAGYALRVWDDNGLNKLIFMINDGSVFNNIETDSLEPGTCYHVAAVREDENIRLYLDGILKASLTTATVLNVDTDLFFAIGALSRQPYAITTEFFDGNVDEVRIWNIIRSEEAIRGMMNDTLSAAYYLTPDSGLIAYYKCDEFEDLGIGVDGSDDIRDFSVNSFHADTYDDPVIASTCTVVDIKTETSEMPNTFKLLQNYPNPFNPSTVISYQLPVSSDVVLKVFDVLGNEIATLVDEYKTAGRYEVEFNTTSIKNQTSSGIYFYKLEAGSFVKTRKMVLLK